jgi:hypothetical protein
MAAGEQPVTRPLAVLAGLLLGLSASAECGQLLLDHGRQLAGLWVFPTLDAPDQFVYLPSAARIARDDQGRPLFSFVFYTSEPASPAPDAGELRSITRADGGAVLHFLVEYETPPGQIAQAEAELKRALDDRNARISGAVVFDDGQYAVVSSTAANGRAQPELLALRKAPVLEGNRLALSLRLSAEDAAVLLETFKTSTPDLSVSFDMSFSGLTDAYDAEMVVNWSKVKDAYSLSAGGTLYVVGLQAEASVENLFQNGGITLRQNGQDQPTQALVEAAQARILELLFQPIELEKVPEAQRGGLLDALAAMLGGSGGPTSSAKTIGFGLSGAFQLKQLRSTGTTRLDFATRSRVTRRALLTVNAGDLYRQYGTDRSYFRVTDVSSDLAHDVRQVFVEVDGNLAPEFTRFVNSVQVTLRKRHASGEETTRELVATRANATGLAALGPLSYAAHGDTNAADWLRYEYRTHWSFFGGGVYETPWQPSDQAVILLAAPFHRNVVRLDGDADDLRAKSVRAVDVTISNRLFGNDRAVRRSATLPASGPLSLADVELVLPDGVDEYGYEVTWTLKSGERRVFRGTSSQGTLFVDTL